MVLFILTHFHTKIKFPDWLGKALFWQLLANNPPTVKGGKAGCGSFNCGPRWKSFMDQTQPTKRKIIKTVGQLVCVGPCPICNCCRTVQVFHFFCHCSVFLHDIYSVILTIQNTKQPYELAAGEEVKHLGREGETGRSGDEP